MMAIHAVHFYGFMKSNLSPAVVSCKKKGWDYSEVTSLKGRGDIELHQGGFEHFERTLIGKGQ